MFCFHLLPLKLEVKRDFRRYEKNPWAFPFPNINDQMNQRTTRSLTKFIHLHCSLALQRSASLCSLRYARFVHLIRNAPLRHAPICIICRPDFSDFFDRPSWARSPQLDRARVENHEPGKDVLPNFTVI